MNKQDMCRAVERSEVFVTAFLSLYMKLKGDCWSTSPALIDEEIENNALLKMYAQFNEKASAVLNDQSVFYTSLT